MYKIRQLPRWLLIGGPLLIAALVGIFLWRFWPGSLVLLLILGFCFSPPLAQRWREFWGKMNAPVYTPPAPVVSVPAVQPSAYQQGYQAQSSMQTEPQPKDAPLGMIQVQYPEMEIH